MLKVLLPLGLVAGTIAAINLTTTPHSFSQQAFTLAQAQLNPLDPDETGVVDGMTQEILEEILAQIAEDVEVNQNQVLFTFDSQSLLLITDSNANRMRIIAPVVKAEELTGEAMAKMMLANFHTALDGRYAISNGVVYAAFVHPLSTLDAQDFQSAVAQVANLTKTYGSTYSSGSSLFGAPGAETETTDTLPAI